jgi:hypothetical protein
MSGPATEYLVISRGQWDEDLSPQHIQDAIDRFYEWHQKLVGEGRMKGGQRLAPDRKTVSKEGIVDGPYTEAKEVIGGYWTIRADSLEEAALLAAGNPCIACGLSFEIRPIAPERASAFAQTSETPGARSGGSARDHDAA